jgi:hypothetical protein
MVRSLLVTALVIAGTSAAHAEPAHLYVAAGAMAGIDAGLDVAMTGEAGVHIARSLWAHAMVGAGTTGDDQGGGPLRQYRGGIETRSCDSDTICVLAGVDLGYHHSVWRPIESGTSPDEHHDDMLAAAHFALDLGGSNVRVQPGIEAYYPIVGSDTARGLLGFNLTLALALQY